MCRILQNSCIEKITFWTILLCEHDIFWSYRAFSKTNILKEKVYNVSDFGLKNFQRVRNWNKNCTNGQSLKNNFFKKFSMNQILNS